MCGKSTGGDVRRFGPWTRLHHKERQAVRVADVIDRNNVGVIEGGSSPRFANQTFSRIRG